MKAVHTSVPSQHLIQKVLHLVCEFRASSFFSAAEKLRRAKRIMQSAVNFALCPVLLLGQVDQHAVRIGDKVLAQTATLKIFFDHSAMQPHREFSRRTIW